MTRAIKIFWNYNEEINSLEKEVNDFLNKYKILDIETNTNYENKNLEINQYAIFITVYYEA